ncbi:hypothetical protein [Paludibaculum fermentans]|uniref:hypothetical protein n=1 Tax=Paludibaculum fermentans TaxID=1473598 RepID=UPI003EBDC5FB
MSRPIQFGTSTPVLAGAVLVMVSLGLGAIEPVRALPATAQRFFSYMHAIDQSGQKLGFWDRVTYSLILSGPNPRQPRPPSAARVRL